MGQDGARSSLILWIICSSRARNTRFCEASTVRSSRVRSSVWYVLAFSLEILVVTLTIRWLGCAGELPKSLLHLFWFRGALEGGNTRWKLLLLNACSWDIRRRALIRGFASVQNQIFGFLAGTKASHRSKGVCYLSTRVISENQCIGFRINARSFSSIFDTRWDVWSWVIILKSKSRCASWNGKARWSGCQSSTNEWWSRERHVCLWNSAELWLSDSMNWWTSCLNEVISLDHRSLTEVI